MDKIIFTCKTITPLVMNGAYGDHPELRPPGIKASLRFWWRALHGHLTLDQLREQEGKIFGNTKGRSKLLLRLIEDIGTETIKQSILPHKGGSIASAFPTNKVFKIRLDCESGQIEMLKNLYILACTLGGWGKRSRRGFGSVAVTEINMEEYATPTTLDSIHHCIGKIVGSGKFNLNGSKITAAPITKNNNEEYPRLLEIQIGQEIKTLENIGQATHQVKFNSIDKHDYSNSLGDGRPRLASPVYVSILSNGLPIITTLKKPSRVNIEIQNELKSKILNP